MQAIQTMANEALVNVALGVITLLAACAMYYVRVGVAKLKVQTAQIGDDAARQLLINALEDVESLAEKSVGALEQTTAKTLRQAVKNGTKDREELLALGSQAFVEIKAAVTPEAQRMITKNLGSFDDYLTKCIEDSVRRVKQHDPHNPVSQENPHNPLSQEDPNITQGSEALAIANGS